VDTHRDEDEDRDEEEVWCCRVVSMGQKESEREKCGGEGGTISATSSSGQGDDRSTRRMQALDSRSEADGLSVGFSAMAATHVT
jgi:hypothetical protein